MIKSRMIAVALALASAQALAAESSITKSLKPDNIVIATRGIASSQFHIARSDFPNQVMIAATKTIRSVSWDVTRYPDNLGETIDICYSRPYNTSWFEHCRRVDGPTGSTSEFNAYRFDIGAKFVIQHRVSGGKNHSAAVGLDTLTINYNY